MLRKLGITLMIVVMAVASGCGSTEDANSPESDSDAAGSSNTDEEKIKRISHPNNKLAFSLLKRAKPNEENNVFVSPTSLFMALSMLYNGADGKTKEEIANALQTKGITTKQLNTANAAFAKKLRNYSDINLDMANSVWVNDRYTLDENFQQTLKVNYDAAIDTIDINDKKSANRINDWVADATHDKITEIVDPPLDERLVALLINATYFKGDWKYRFDSKLTKKTPFHNGSGDVSNIPMMKMEEKLRYMENEQIQVVELPYTDYEMSMQVFLPKQNSDLDELKQSLTAGKWQDWRDSMKKTEGTLLLPKFKMDYEATLNSVLTDMGMVTAFDQGKAEFPGIVEEADSIWIDRIKQKTFLEVNEKGTEAAAVTSTEMRTTSINPDAFQMKVDRPFLLTITDSKTDTILFTGSISNLQ